MNQSIVNVLERLLRHWTMLKAILSDIRRKRWKTIFPCLYFTYRYFVFIENKQHTSGKHALLAEGKEELDSDMLSLSFNHWLTHFSLFWFVHFHRRLNQSTSTSEYSWRFDISSAQLHACCTRTGAGTKSMKFSVPQIHRWDAGEIVWFWHFSLISKAEIRIKTHFLWSQLRAESHVIYFASHHQ